jgi:hypothetical protein
VVDAAHHASRRLGPVARGLLALALLGATVPGWGEAYCGALVPLVEWVLRGLVTGWQHVAVRLADIDGQGVVLARFTTVAGFDYHGFAVPPGAWVEARTLHGYWMQHPVLVLAVWAAWPQATLAARLISAVPVPIALMGLGMVDIPLTLYGAVTDMMLAGAAPERLDTSLPVHVMQLLEGGGRAVLSLAVGVGVAACGRAFEALRGRGR